MPSRRAIAAGILLLFAVVLAHASPDRPFASLLVKAESDLVLIVDGETVGSFSAGEVRTVKVGRGQHLIQARRPEGDSPVWERVMATEQPKQYFLRIDLREPSPEPEPAPAPAEPEAPAEPLPRQPGEGMVYDEKTDLIWTAEDNGGMIDWNEATQYCEQLELGGWDDWRLPTFEELEALYSESVEGDWKIRLGIELTDCCVWTRQTPYSYSATMLNFMSGKAHVRDRDEQDFERALCVRGRPPGE
jgi:hypothetical protein